MAINWIRPPREKLFVPNSSSYLIAIKDERIQMINYKKKSSFKPNKNLPCFFHQI
jgi:hypothetical protein